jgi:hypothetical protein
MIATTVVQCACLIFSLVCLGQAINNGATKFDKISFCVFCLIFLLLCVCLQGVK